jgi:hypothetical protein
LRDKYAIRAARAGESCQPASRSGR